MALNITEAHAVNRLANYILGQPRRGEHITGEQALEALALLADKANKTLMAGLNSDTVRELWAGSPAATITTGERTERS